MKSPFSIGVMEDFPTTFDDQKVSKSCSKLVSQVEVPPKDQPGRVVGLDLTIDMFE